LNYSHALQFVRHDKQRHRLKADVIGYVHDYKSRKRQTVRGLG